MAHWGSWYAHDHLAGDPVYIQTNANSSHSLQYIHVLYTYCANAHLWCANSHTHTRIKYTLAFYNTLLFYIILHCFQQRYTNYIIRYCMVLYSPYSLRLCHIVTRYITFLCKMVLADGRLRYDLDPHMAGQWWHPLGRFAWIARKSKIFLETAGKTIHKWVIFRPGRLIYQRDPEIQRVLNNSSLGLKDLVHLLS